MGLFMGIFLHGYFRPFIFFRVPIVFALAPPMGSGTMRAGPWPGPHGHISGISTAFNPGAAPPVLRAGRAWCVLIRAVPSLVRPARADRRLDRSPAAGAGSWRALWGGYGCVLPALLVCTFQGAAKGEVFPPFAVLPKKGLGEYPHAANFSKYFFMSRRIRSLRLITARWVTPIRRASSLVERRS